MKKEIEKNEAAKQQYTRNPDFDTSRDLWTQRRSGKNQIFAERY